MSGILSTHLRDHVIDPTLNLIADVTGYQAIASDAAKVIMLGTAATESHCGYYLTQHPSGPALGIYQMEPDTHDWLWEYLERKPTIRDAVLLLSSHDGQPPANEMITNLAYATAMARVYYWTVPEPLPNPGDLYDMGRYWKRYYNTSEGSGRIEKFVGDFKTFAREARP